MEIIINSIDELKDLFKTYSCVTEIDNTNYRKTRYVSGKVFDNLIKYELDFEPFISIKNRIFMSGIPLMRSETTNRYYIGFVNLGGHGPAFEIRPVRLSDVLDFKYIERMYENHGLILDREIELNANYDI